MRKWNVCIPLKKRKSYQDDVVSGDFIIWNIHVKLVSKLSFWSNWSSSFFCNKTEDSSNNCYGFIGGNPLNLYLPCLVVLLLNLYSPWFWSICLLNFSCYLLDNLNFVAFCFFSISMLLPALYTEKFKYFKMSVSGKAVQTDLLLLGLVNS